MTSKFCRLDRAPVLPKPPRTLHPPALLRGLKSTSWTRTHVTISTPPCSFDPARHFERRTFYRHQLCFAKKRPYQPENIPLPEGSGSAYLSLPIPSYPYLGTSKRSALASTELLAQGSLFLLFTIADNQVRLKLSVRSIRCQSSSPNLIRPQDPHCTIHLPGNERHLTRFRLTV